MFISYNDHYNNPSGLDEIQALLELLAERTNLLQSDAPCSVAVGHSAIDSEFTVSPAANRPITKYPSTKTAAAMLLNELHKRFQPNHGCEL